ncbi:oligosaccharide repeat unit polymerase [Geomonas sp. Red69]|nr:oligosaccharide repeat unit polymerase [Geomonas diazotrophica]QXE85032.1 oligosaccharide repeat unit polymerase [Geomonas nitrogeniifigens]
MIMTDKSSVYLHTAFIFLLMAFMCITYFANDQHCINRLTAFVINYILTSSIFLIVYHRKNKTDLLSPVIGFVVLLFLYSVASAVDVETNLTTYYGDYISDDTLTQYYAICLIGLSGLMLGILAVKTEISSKVHLKLPSNRLIRQCIIAMGIVLGAVFAVNLTDFFDFLHIKSYGEMALISRVEKMKDSTAGLVEVFTQKIPIAYILSSATILMFKRHWLLRLVGFTIIVDYLVVNTLSGWRGLVISAAVTVFAYYHYRVREIKLRTGIMIGSFLYLFMNVMSIVRVTSNPLEMLSVFWDYFSVYGAKFLQLSSSGELIVGENLMRLIQGISDGETHFSYGWSIITELMVFMPRIFFDERPLPLNEQFVEVFYPGVREIGGGYGFFFLQEGYWAFGAVGVFIFMFCYGLITQKIYQKFRKYCNNDLVLLSYGGIYYALVISSVRNGILGSVKATLMSLIPFVIVYVALKVFRSLKAASRINSKLQRNGIEEPVH